MRFARRQLDIFLVYDELRSAFSYLDAAQGTPALPPQGAGRRGTRPVCAGRRFSMAGLRQDSGDGLGDGRPRAFDFALATTLMASDSEARSAFAATPRRPPAADFILVLPFCRDADVYAHDSAERRRWARTSLCAQPVTAISAEGRRLMTRSPPLRPHFIGVAEFARPAILPVAAGQADTDSRSFCLGSATAPQATGQALRDKTGGCAIIELSACERASFSTLQLILYDAFTI